MSEVKIWILKDGIQRFKLKFSVSSVLSVVYKMKRGKTP